jgi:hypothetical protein
MNPSRSFDAKKAALPSMLTVLALFALAWMTGCAGGGSGAPGGGGFLGDLTRPIEGKAMRATSAMRVGELRRGPNGEREIGPRKYDPKADFKGDGEVQSNWDNYTVPAGGTHVLMNESGPGVITHIWITFLGPEPQNWAPRGSANHQELMLRMYWDDNPRPAVEAPLGDFFANNFGERREVISLPVVVEDADSYNCFWRMPFRKSARIEIENQNQGGLPLSMLYFNIDWIKLDDLPRDTPYFYAQYRQEYPAVNGKDYLVLETSGKGHYVGTVLAVRMRSPAWFGEGDEKIYVDGETKASIWGTGTEDYFLSAWGLKTTGTPYFGVPFFDSRGIGGHTSAYRWHIADPMPFEKSLKVTFEHMGWMSQDENPEYKSTSWNEREDDYASVAFWYQTGVPTFAERAPGAADRHLPDLSRVTVKAADLAASARHGEGAVSKRTSDRFGAEDLIYQPRQASGGWIEIPFEVKAKEPLHLILRGTRTVDGGSYQALLNGIKIGRPLDFYAEASGRQEFQLLDFWPEPGTYTLRLESVGKNPKSTGTACAVESVRLLERRPRVAKFGHDKDKDWRKAPTLYR